MVFLSGKAVRLQACWHDAGPAFHSLPVWIHFADDAAKARAVRFPKLRYPRPPILASTHAQANGDEAGNLGEGCSGYIRVPAARARACLSPRALASPSDGALFQRDVPARRWRCLLPVFASARLSLLRSPAWASI